MKKILAVLLLVTIMVNVMSVALAEEALPIFGIWYRFDEYEGACSFSIGIDGTRSADSLITRYKAIFTQVDTILNYVYPAYEYSVFVDGADANTYYLVCETCGYIATVNGDELELRYIDSSPREISPEKYQRVK